MGRGSCPEFYPSNTPIASVFIALLAIKYIANLLKFTPNLPSNQHSFHPEFQGTWRTQSVQSDNGFQT